MKASYMEVMIFDLGGKRLFSQRGNPADVYPALRKYCEDALGLNMPVRSFEEGLLKGIEKLGTPMSERINAGRADGKA